MTGSSSADSVSILLGNGDGSFQGPIDYAIGSATGWGLQVEDLNGDGKMDIVTANTLVNTVSVLFGNGDGTFQARRNMRRDLGQFDLAIGDIDGGGRWISQPPW